MDKGREFLLSQVQAAEQKYEAAVRTFSDALNALKSSKTDVLAFRGALEAYTRGGDFPYHPSPLIDPLEELSNIKEEGQSPVKKEKIASPKPPRITKIGIVQDTLENRINGRGAKFKQVFAALPPDAPIKITKDDLYRALAKLQAQEKAWRDKHGYYRAGQPDLVRDAAILSDKAVVELFSVGEEETTASE